METQICAMESLLRLGDRVCDDPPIVQVQQYPATEWVVSLHAKPGHPALVEGKAETFDLAVLNCLKKLMLVVGERARGDMESLMATTFPVLALERAEALRELPAGNAAVSLLETQGGKS
jgi:hypothetical protein